MTYETDSVSCPKMPRTKRNRAHLYLTEWREYRGLRTTTMAARIGVPQSTYFRWETEQVRLNPAKILLIADALGIDYRQLYYPPQSAGSVDAVLDGVNESLRATARDIVLRLVGRA